MIEQTEPSIEELLIRGTKDTVELPLQNGLQEKLLETPAFTENNRYAKDKGESATDRIVRSLPLLKQMLKRRTQETPEMPLENIPQIPQEPGEISSQNCPGEDK